MGRGYIAHIKWEHGVTIVNAESAGLPNSKNERSQGKVLLILPETKAAEYPRLEKKCPTIAPLGMQFRRTIQRAAKSTEND